MHFSLSSLSAILAYALQGIVAVEQVLPQPGLGKTKKEILLSGVELLAKTAPGLTDSNTVAIAGAFIDATVASLKAAQAGPFGKKAPTTP